MYESHSNHIIISKLGHIEPRRLLRVQAALGLFRRGAAICAACFLSVRFTLVRDALNIALLLSCETGRSPAQSGEQFVFGIKPGDAENFPLEFSSGVLMG